MHHSFLLIFSCILVCLSGLAAGAIYQWKDASGVVHFSDSPQKGAVVITPKPTSVYTPARQSFVTSRRPSNSTSFTYYDAYPTSMQNLREALFAATPILFERKPYLGLTNWNIEWATTTRQMQKRCQIDTADAGATIKYTMPRLGNRSSLNSNTLQAFDDFYDRLFEHEEGHANNGKAAAKEIQTALLLIPPQATCADLYPLANKSVNDVIARYNEEDKRYDRDTDHGLTQGARIQ